MRKQRRPSSERSIYDIDKRHPLKGAKHYDKLVIGQLGLPRGGACGCSGRSGGYRQDDTRQKAQQKRLRLLLQRLRGRGLMPKRLTSAV
jgi:hypothetical protein